MGQYWIPVNLDKKEYIDPHKLGCGLKLWEQLANHPSTGTALIVLTAAQRELRGGGDFDVDENWHGSERTFPEHNITPGPMPETYPEIATRTIGRWAGDRIAFVGDYAVDKDMPSYPGFGKVYFLCQTLEDAKLEIEAGEINPDDLFMDITDDVCAVIEHELGGKFEGDGWRRFVRDEDAD